MSIDELESVSMGVRIVVTRDELIIDATQSVVLKGAFSWEALDRMRRALSPEISLDR